MAKTLRILTFTLSNVGNYFLSKWGRDPSPTGLTVALVGGGIWILFVAVVAFLFVLAAAIHIGMVALVLVVLWGLLVRATKAGRLHGALSGLPEPLIADVSAYVKSQPGLAVIRGRAHDDALLKAFDDAEFGIAVLSGWSTDFTVISYLEEKIEAALKRGVAVYIGYGMVRAWGKKKSGAPAPEKQDVPEWRKKFTIQELPSRANLLIVDDRYAVFGTHNWLSQTGYFSLDKSWKITDTVLVRRQLRAALELFGARGHSV